MVTGRLQGKVAVVTGSGRGIGRCEAMALAREGAMIVVSDFGKDELGRDLAVLVTEEILAAGGKAIAVTENLMTAEGAKRTIEAAKNTFGGLDIIVNNAGGSMSKPFLETSVEQIEKSFHFNVSVPFELVRLATPHLLQSGNACVVNISSVAGQHALRGSFTHSLTKNSKSHLTKLMAAELAPRIRVNAVLPGAIETDALATYLSTRGAEIRDTMHANTLMRRNGTPQDIADAVLFLASPAACWITGKLLEVDGGAAENLVPKALPDLQP